MLKLVTKDDVDMKFAVKYYFQHDRVKHRMHAMNRYWITSFRLKERDSTERTTELKILLSLSRKVPPGSGPIIFACLSKTPSQRN